MKNRKPRNKSSISANKETQKKKKKEIPSYRNIPCDSLNERWCLMYLFELEKLGYIIKGSIGRSKTYTLFNTVTRNYNKRLKTRSVPMTETLLQAAVYTPDFVFTLSDKGKKFQLFKDINVDEKLFTRSKYIFLHQKGEVHIEVKGTRFRGENDTTEKFSITKKWLWEKHKVYTNLFTHDKVFPLTWTPAEYLTTDITKQKRSIKWEVKNIEKYVNEGRKS